MKRNKVEKVDKVDQVEKAENAETPKRETFEQLHDKPIFKMNRRELLGAGVIQFAATIAAPSLLGILAKGPSAFAAELNCPVSGAGTLPPFLTINLAGGAGLAANFVPHDQGLNRLNSYSKLGLGSAGALATTSEFKNGAPFAAISQVMAGIRQTATPTTLANTVFVGVPNRSQDDSAMNKLNMDGMVIKAGRLGQILPTLGANRNVAAFVTPPNPLPVSNFNNIADAIGVKNSLASLSSSQQTKLFALSQKLTTTQAAKLVGLTGGEQLRTLVQCAAKDNTALISTTDPGINPTSNTAYSNLWNINANNMGNANFTFASIVYNVIRGNAPTGNITLGGYDYHNGTRTTGDQRDLEAGQLIGRVLQSLALLGKKGFLVVTSDGAVTSVDSEVPGGAWTSDRGTAGIMYMMAYDPAGSVSASSFQLGHFLKDAQAVDQSFITGGSPEKGAAGVVANYLNFAGKIGLFQGASMGAIADSDLSKVLKIAG